MRFSRNKLFTAIRKQDIEFVQNYLEQGVDVNLTEKVNDGLTPIEFAAYKNDTEICKLLLNFKPNLSLTKRLIFWTAYHSNNRLFSLFINSNSPIHQIDECLFEACTRDNAFQIDILIKKGANVNSYFNDLTPLHRIARYGSINSIKLLVENNAHLNVKDKNNKTPFNYAVFYNKFEIVEYLFNEGCETGGVIEKNKFYGVGSKEMLEFYRVLLERDSKKLIEFKKNLFKRLEFLEGGKLEDELKQSIIKSDFLIFQKIISKNKDKINLNVSYSYENMEKVTPLHLAIIYRNYKMVKLLLENNVDTNCTTDNQLDIYYFLECDEQDEQDEITLSILNLIRNHKKELEEAKRKIIEYKLDSPKIVKTIVEKRDGGIYATVYPINKIPEHNSNVKNESFQDNVKKDGFLIRIKKLFKK
jgi:ankyrin repeat protein